MEEKENIKYIILKDYKVKQTYFKNVGLKELIFILVTTGLAYIVGQLFFEPLLQLFTLLFALAFGIYMAMNASKTPKRTRLESLQLYAKYVFEHERLQRKERLYEDSRRPQKHVSRIKATKKKHKNRK